MAYRSSWLLPQTQETDQAHARAWYEESDALAKAGAMPSAKVAWDMSPLRTEIGIQTGRVLNFAFIIGAIAATPPAIALSPLTSFICIAAAAAMGLHFLHVKNPKILRTALAASEIAPKSVQGLCKACFNRAGLNPDIDTLLVHPSREAKSLLGRQLPATIGVTTYKGRTTVLIGSKALQKLSMDELEATICHETSHIKNKYIPGRTFVEQTALRSGLMFFAASLLTGNFLGAAYFLSIQILANSASKALKRKDEYRADRNAVGLSGKGEALISALTKMNDLLCLELAKGDPFKAAKYKKAVEERAWMMEHPSIPKRAAYIRKISRSMPTATQP